MTPVSHRPTLSLLAEPAADLTHLQGSVAALLALGGESAAIRRLRKQIRIIGRHLRSALLVGDPGASPLLVARQLHLLGPAPSAPLIELSADIVNAAAASGTQDLFQDLHVLPGSTLVLEDVANLNAAAQAALVNLFHTGEPARRPRVIACAARPLKSDVSTGAFRADLQHELSSILIHLPELSERTADLHGLLPAALSAVAAELSCPEPSVSEDQLDSLVSEAQTTGLSSLEQSLRQLVLRSAAGMPAPEPAEQPAPTPIAEVRMLSLQQVIDAHLLRVLHHCDGNKLRAAEVLGISRSTLYRMLEGMQAAS